MAAGARPRLALDARIALYGTAAAACFAALLAILFVRGQWIANPKGTPILADFLPFYLAGQAALHGHAATAYDDVSFRQLQAAIIPPGQGWYLWAYPPTLLLIVAPLSLLPYAIAYVGWEIVTLALLAASVRAIVLRRSAAPLVLASPLSWLNFFIGQDGAFTGALMGATLVWLERQPLLAGIALGMLTYKPQFGVLFPLVLGAAGRWRAMIAATATAIILAGAATAVFGVRVWEQFFFGMTMQGRLTLNIGDVAWGKVQTIYGLLRAAGGSAGLAWAAQIAVSLAVTVVVCRFWRRPAPYPLKAATLAAGAMIVTPYALTYDLAAFAVPVAFMVRDRIERGPVAGDGFAAGALLIALVLTSPGSPIVGRVALGPLMLLGLILLALHRRDAPAASP